MSYQCMNIFDGKCSWLPREGFNRELKRYITGLIKHQFNPNRCNLTVDGKLCLNELESNSCDCGEHEGYYDGATIGFSSDEVFK